MAVAPIDGSPQALYAKLRPGPGMAADDVAAHQKARLRSAMIELAGVPDRGYASIKIGELTRLAGVSTRAFYEHFAGKEACFLNAHEQIIRRTAKRVIISQAGERDWEKRLRLAFRAFARELEREPLAARLALVEAHSVAPTAKEQTRWGARLFAAMLVESLERGGEKTSVPPLYGLGLAAGITCVARSRLLWGDEGSTGLGDELAEWVLCCHRELQSGEAPGCGGATQLPLPPTRERDNEPGAPMSERSLIVSATFKLAGCDDSPLTSASIRAAAGVSRKAFETHFESVADCVIAAAESRADDAFARAALAKATSDSWQEGVRLAMAALCDQVARDPALARLCFIELDGLGQPGLLCGERLMAEIGDLICHDAPSDQCTDDLATEASTGAIWGIMRELVAAGQRQQLPRVAPMLTSLAIAPSRQRLPVPSLG